MRGVGLGSAGEGKVDDEYTCTKRYHKYKLEQFFAVDKIEVINAFEAM